MPYCHYLVVLLVKYEGCWLGVLKLCELWKNMFCGTEVGFAWSVLSWHFHVFTENISGICQWLRNSGLWFSENSNLLLECLCQCFTILCVAFYSCNNSWSICAADNVFSSVFHMIQALPMHNHSIFELTSHSVQI